MALSIAQLSKLNDGLKQLDPLNTGMISRSSQVLTLLKVNLKFTSAEVDEALLLFKVDPATGNTSYQRVLEELKLRQNQISEPIKTMPQRELVFKLSKILRELFCKLDDGSLSAQAFVEELNKLGLKETQALRDLLRHDNYNVEFQKLVQALITEDEVVTKQVPFFGVSGSNQQQSLGVGKSSIKMFKNVTNKSQGISGDVKSSEVVNHDEKQHADKASDESSGGAIALKERAEVKKDEKPLIGNEKLLRQQVLALLRKLDGGEIDLITFSNHLKDMGITKLPEGVERLMYKFGADNESVKFREWVFQFESLFVGGEEEKESVVEKPAEETSEYRFTKALAGAKLVSNGDVLAWTNSPSTLEKQKSYKPKRHDNLESTRLTFADEAKLEERKTRGGRNASNVSANVNAVFFNSNQNEDVTNTFGSNHRAVRTHEYMRSREAPFAKEGDVYDAKVVGKTHVKARIPFGTEADIRESFADGLLPHERKKE